MYTLNIKGKLRMVDKPLVMGILNLTPDSFYEGSRFIPDKAAEAALNMEAAGAAFVDIGGQSTRPGSVRIAANEEADRVLPALEAIVAEAPNLLVSVDTYHADVARQAVAAGAGMINDISAGHMDMHMLKTVAGLHVPYICMHMQGSPQTMQHQPQYNDVVTEVTDFFIERLEACRQAGIHDVLIDPGFGFGKTQAHNYTLLRRLHEFSILKRPLVIGLSRKRMIYGLLGKGPEDALNGTTALHTIALLHGASILRVHDVAAAVECVALLQALQENP